MPPKEEHGPTQNTIRGKHPMPTHVVPAIPLALSKPKATKPKAGVYSERPRSATVNGGLHTRVEPGKMTAQLEVEIGPFSKVSEKREVAEEEKADSPFAALLHNSAQQPPSVDKPSGLQAPQANRPPTPPSTDEGHTSSPTITSSPDTVRKPTERFDIRQIRTDFPPAFVPAAEQHTPQSTTSSQSRPQLPTRPPTHPQHPSVGSIVFGGRESSTSSPAPPQSTIPTFAPPAYASPVGPGHGYHASEPNVPRGFHPGHQPPPPWPVRHGHAPSIPHPHFHPPQHVPFRQPPRETFTPVPAPYINGHGLRSRHGSRSSSVAAPDGQRPVPDLQSPIGHDAMPDEGRPIYPEPRDASTASSRQHTSAFFAPPPHVPPPFQYPEYAANYENMEAMRVHLLNSFGTPELADCRLHILDKQTGAQQSLFSHKIVLARSPRLLQMMRDNVSPVASMTHTDIAFALEGKYLRIPALVDVIRCLYGGPLPPFDPYRAHAPTAESSNFNEERMQLMLQYIATGTWLQVPVIAQRATEIAINLLNWSTLPALLSFALEGGLSAAWAIDDGSTEGVSTCSSDDSFIKPETGGSPIHEPHSTYILHRILAFIVFTLPPNFYLDTTAPQLATSPRLPATAPTHQSRPSRSDPRLSKIRFGEIAADDHQRPSPLATTISSILLSLPYPLLRSLLEHHDLTHRLGPETVSSIMRSVIQERELRRQRALKEHPSALRGEASDNSLVQNLYWVESVEPSDQLRTGCRLARRRREIDTPSSSGTESDRQR